MSNATLIAFWAVSLLFVVTPGADWAYAITAGVQHRRIAPAVGGLLAGHFVATLLVAAGLAALLAGAPDLMTAITFTGAAYLAWLGTTMIRSSADASVTAVESAEGGWLGQAARGLGTSALNPKLFLLFLALLPQFVDPDAQWAVPVQIVALGIVHVVSCGIVYSIVAVASRTILRSRPAAARIVTRVSGGAMVAIGVALVAEQLLT